MKKCYLVKFVSAFCMLLCLQQAQGQTYYNFALGGLPTMYNPSHAIIRTIDAQRAVAYYGGLTSKHIVAAGGDYWLMKDIIDDIPSTTCYKIAQQKVVALQLSPGIQSNYIYGTFLLGQPPLQKGAQLPTLPLLGDCITP